MKDDLKKLDVINTIISRVEVVEKPTNINEEYEYKEYIDSVKVLNILKEDLESSILRDLVFQNTDFFERNEIEYHCLWNIKLKNQYEKERT